MSAATVLVTGSNRRAGLGLAAAIAVEAATASGAGTLLAEVGPGAQRRSATLLAAPAARRLEDSLAAAGRRAAARGHVCHLPIDTDEEPLDVLTPVLAESGAELAFLHLPSAMWVPALGLDLGTIGGCLLVELPCQRSLAALAVGELGGRGLRARVATVAPAALAARRALAGVPAGGAAAVRARRLASALLGWRPR